MIRNFYILLLLIFIGFTVKAQNFFGTHHSGQSAIPKNCVEYGLLYNWYAATDSRNIANIGWHVPSQSEWDTLREFLDPGSDGSASGNVAGKELKEAGTLHWYEGNTGTNSTGFTAVGGASRDYSLGIFGSPKIYADFFTTTELNETYIYCVYMQYDIDAVQTSGYISQKPGGKSARLVKDTTTLSDGEHGTYVGNDGREYRTICIGTQEWLTDNLMETQFRDGNLIPFHGADNDTAFTDTEWAALTTAGVCAYNNDVSLVACDFEWDVNNRPIAQDTSFTIDRLTNETCDLQQNISDSDFAFTDEEGDTLTAVKIVGLPGSGSIDTTLNAVLKTPFTLTYTSDVNTTEEYVDTIYYLAQTAGNNSFSSDTGMMVLNVSSCEQPVECYGYLYNWYAATDSRKITSSDDWEVPTLGDENGDYGQTMGDYYILTEFIGWRIVDEPYGYLGKIKEIGTRHWNLPNSGAENFGGFNLLPNSLRSSVTGEFNGLGGNAYLMSRSGSREGIPTNTNFIKFFYSSTSAVIVGDEPNTKKYGLAVRLVNNNTSLLDGQTGNYVGNDGKVYKTICIGNQEWLAENLEETQYRNGDPIYWVKDNTEWANLTEGACCIYNNDTTYACQRPLPIEEPQIAVVGYGDLYSYFTIYDARNIANTGWHVPTWQDGKDLRTYLGNAEGGGN
ncbi:FISUMP domain-containing protein [Draconibacterium sediminis]|uniref:FISUMP domain-containing protein n=1 Tax=Draconibacterium sediminis TaxID=1544798 RepID=UPI0026EC4EF5|nr:FISUMP domain-containing protein [Draconibacterium sediminis]